MGIFNRRLHWIIIIKITGIVLFSIAGAWLLISKTSLFLAFICACMVLLLAILIVKRTEKTNRQLKYFFSAIRNNDFTIHLTETSDDEFIKGLFHEMNRIRIQFEEKQTELEEQQLYYESIIRVLTHEIRNSITPIASLSADLVQHREEYGEKGTIDGLETIRQQAQQLKTFLNASHRLTHLPDPVKANVPIHTLFDKLKHLLSSEPGSQNIHYIASETVEIFLDRNLITLALINLIRNALQALTNHPAPAIRVETGKEGNTTFIQITDNGEGIPSSRLDDIFTPFYSTRREGSGIGLPLSRRIMQLHGGELTVTSTPGERTTFRMTFPDF